MKPVYFDLTVTDVGKAKEFFSAVLAWEFNEFAPGYYRIRAGSEDEMGIDGGIAALESTAIAKAPMTVLVVPVEDLDAMMGKVEINGGRVFERRVAIPGIGWFSSCSEPGGLIFGMIQPDQTVR